MRLSWVVLNFFIFFFYEKILQAQKAQRPIQANKNKKGSIFMRMKVSKKSHMFTCLTFFCFFMLTKTPKKKKIACLMFLYFFMLIKNV